MLTFRADFQTDCRCCWEVYHLVVRLVLVRLDLLDAFLVEVHLDVVAFLLEEVHLAYLVLHHLEVVHPFHLVLVHPFHLEGHLDVVAYLDSHSMVFTGEVVILNSKVDIHHHRLLIFVEEVFVQQLFN